MGSKRDLGSEKDIRQPPEVQPLPAGTARGGRLRTRDERGPSKGYRYSVSLRQGVLLPSAKIGQPQAPGAPPSRVCGPPVRQTLPPEGDQRTRVGAQHQKEGADPAD